MYTKEELESMEIPELMGIAKNLGVEVSQNSELSDVIYAIIDKAAESAASEQTGETTKRKRTRITKKDTNKVYTVKGKEGENLDSKTNRKKGRETPSLFSDAPLSQPEEDVKETAAEPAPEAPVEEAPKRRGRKTKAEKLPKRLQRLNRRLLYKR